jgi:ornithine cyclodeaminase/alanine dehydrogenase-like protein (mu-crystallin family)
MTTGPALTCALAPELRPRASHNGELEHAVEIGGDRPRGRGPGRESDDEITCFDSTGLAIQDLAIALAALERAASPDLPHVDL